MTKTLYFWFQATFGRKKGPCQECPRLEHIGWILPTYSQPFLMVFIYFIYKSTFFNGFSYHIFSNILAYFWTSTDLVMLLFRSRAMRWRRYQTRGNADSDKRVGTVQVSASTQAKLILCYMSVRPSLKREKYGNSNIILTNSRICISIRVTKY